MSAQRSGGRSPLRELFDLFTGGPSPRPGRSRAQRTRRSMPVRPAGAVHDLRRIADQVNECWFEGRVDVPITWGRDTSRKSVRSRRLGSWRRGDRMIVIHPVLDDERVPEFVVAFVVYHEMLHALQPENTRRPHDAAFRSALRAHPDHGRAMAWQREHRDLLLGGGATSRR